MSRRLLFEFSRASCRSLLHFQLYLFSSNNFFNFSNLKGIICPSKLCNKKYRLPYSFTSKRPSNLFTSSIDWKTIPCLRMRTYFLCLPSSAVRLCHIYLLLHGQRFDIPTKIPRSRLQSDRSYYMVVKHGRSQRTMKEN